MKNLLCAAIAYLCLVSFGVLPSPDIQQTTVQPSVASNYTKVLNVPFYNQNTSRTGRALPEGMCGATSLQMLLEYYGKVSPDPTGEQIESLFNAYRNQNGDVYSENVIAALKAYKINARTVPFSYATVQNMIVQDKPVLFISQLTANGMDKGGHMNVITGIQNDQLIFSDGNAKGPRVFELQNRAYLLPTAEGVWLMKPHQIIIY